MAQNSRILLVEDDEIDVEAITRAFDQVGFHPDLRVARNGIEALQLLRSAKPDGSELVLLDLNMPLMNGFELLEEIRGEEALKRTLVFVLTTSKLERDRAKAYDYNVAGYLVKNGGLKRFATLLRDYVEAVELP